MLPESHHITRKRLTEAVKASPRDRVAREELAAFYRSQGRDSLAEEQERKAEQTARFNPDYDYKAKLQKYDLQVNSYANGEIVKITDGVYNYYAAPGKLQEYLNTVPEEKWAAWEMPIEELGPPLSVLEHLADPHKTPGRYIKTKDGETLKQLADGSWLLLEKDESPVFFTPSQAKSLGFEHINELEAKHVEAAVL